MTNYELSYPLKITLTEYEMIKIERRSVYRYIL